MTKSLFNKVTWTYHEIPTFFVSFLLWSSPSSFLLSQWGSQVSTFFHVPTLVICTWGFSIAMDICCFIFFWKFYYLLLLCYFLVFSAVCFSDLLLNKWVCLATLDLLVNLRMSKWITWNSFQKYTRYWKKKRSSIRNFLYSLQLLFSPQS